MRNPVKALCVIFCLICASYLIINLQKEQVVAEKTPIKGVWAATLYSMDFPSKPTTDSEALKKDLDTLVEDVLSHGFDTVFFQVRPTGDAFYKSEIFPWSRYLTGSEDLAPDNNFDPLQYLVSVAHKRGVMVHAWVNPYRITASEEQSLSLTEKSIAKKYPDITVLHTDKKLYLDPGQPQSRKIVVDGIMEIVENYDIDGIHIDDYFYPSSAFPDGETFSKYGGDFSNIGDFRRSNTTKLVREIGEEIKKADESIVFSVSPSGIWANKDSNPLGSETSGHQSYYDYYADTRLWVKENLVDIIIPQVYWNIGYSYADFETVAKWWNNEVKGTKVKLLIGQAAYKASDETESTSPWYGEKGRTELKNQLDMINRLENVSGYVQYRLGSLTKNKELGNFLAMANTNNLSHFTDTKDFPWAEEAINRLYSKGIVNGMGDGTFGCRGQVSRADFVVMLMRISKQNVPFTQNFADVSEDKYYYKEVGTAKALGFVNGREDNTFDPKGSITREDMATMAYRVAGAKFPKKDKTTLSEKFLDANQISHYAEEAVGAMVNQKFLSGYDTGEFKPKGFATRAECAVFLEKLSTLYE